MKLTRNISILAVIIDCLWHCLICLYSQSTPTGIGAAVW